MFCACSFIRGLWSSKQKIITRKKPLDFTRDVRRELVKCLIYKKLFKKLSNVEIEVRMSALQFFFCGGGEGSLGLQYSHLCVSLPPTELPHFFVKWAVALITLSASAILSWFFWELCFTSSCAQLLMFTQKGNNPTSYYLIRVIAVR